MAFSPERLLVTGGAGFIGSNFVRMSLARNERLRIVNLDKLTYAGSMANLEGLEGADRHVFEKGDITDGETVSRLFDEHSFDAVVHFAAESHVDRSITAPGAFIDTNIIGTCTLLNTALATWAGDSACRFLHISTDEVYGSLARDDAAFSEDSPYAPNSPYSASKAASDHLVRAWHHTFGLPVVTTNCSNNYGPYQHDEKFIPTVIRSCVNQEAIPVYGDGSNIRDWLHVADHCEGIWSALDGGELGETYNLGGGHEVSNLDIVASICAVMDELRPANAPHERLISFVEDRPGHDWRYAINRDKASRELQWGPARDFATGIRETVEWYLQHRYSD